MSIRSITEWFVIFNIKVFLERGQVCRMKEVGARCSRTVIRALSFPSLMKRGVFFGFGFLALRFKNLGTRKMFKLVLTVKK